MPYINFPEIIHLIDEILYPPTFQYVAFKDWRMDSRPSLMWPLSVHLGADSQQEKDYILWEIWAYKVVTMEGQSLRGRGGEIQ